MLTVRITDALSYPYTILTKDADSQAGEGYSLHFLDEGSTAEEWQAAAAEMRAACEFSMAELTTLGFQVDRTGQLLTR